MTLPTPSFQPLLDLWFGPLDEHGFANQAHVKRWFVSDEAFDQELRIQFADQVTQAKQGELAEWSLNPKGRLALILLLDQLPRNLFRGEARAFETDRQAQGVCLEGMELGHDKQLQTHERVIYYMPLEHAEDIRYQEMCVHAIEALQKDLPDPVKPRLREEVKYARLHRDIIADFGRFPHRNDALGRSSTPEETQYLTSGPRFGQ